MPGPQPALGGDANSAWVVTLDPMTVVALVIAAFAVVILGLFAVAFYLVRHPEKRGASTAGSGLMTAGFDEVFNPHAAKARDIIDQEQRLVVPAPSPDDDKGIADGRIRIDI
jgi:hypothetical protein